MDQTNDYVQRNIVGQDQCTPEYEKAANVVWEMLTGAQRDMLRALVLRGPLYDGDVPSKSARDDLFRYGLASRACVNGEQGYSVANYYGWDVWGAGNRQGRFGG